MTITTTYNDTPDGPRVGFLDSLIAKIKEREAEAEDRLRAALTEGDTA